MDLKQSFFTIPVRKSKTPLLKFMFRNVSYCMNRLPRGFKNSSNYLNKLTRLTLEDVPDGLAFYDNILISTTMTLEDHLQQIEKFLANCNKLNVRLSASKAHIIGDDVQIVGYRFHKGKLSIPLARASAIAMHERPATTKKLVSFIAFVRFYSMFCPYFSPFSLPLQDMTLTQQTKKKLSWTDEQSRAFQALKDAMADSVALSPILPDEPIEIATDAAKYACSALLWQRCPTSGETRYLTATSRILQQTEVNWSVIRKEVAAILMAVGQNAYFLAGARKITVYCDSKAVSFLRGTKQSTVMGTSVLSKPILC